MRISINYKDALFKRANLTPIHGEPTFEMLHKLQNEIKYNTNSVYSNLRGGAHVHLGLVLSDAQYALISKTPFVYKNHPGPSIIPDSTTSQVNSNMIISHTKEVCFFH